jgi:hypothetical protein
VRKVNILNLPKIWKMIFYQTNFLLVCFALCSLTAFQLTPNGRRTGKGGSWRTKPPDAESAACPAGSWRGWGRFPESVGECPHLSDAPQQDRKKAIIFPERTLACPEDAVLGVFCS